jgi:uncharacterized protein YktB (UPF0637 family)
VNAPRSCWPNVIQKKKDKKRSKYVTLDFSAHFLFCFFIFVNLREGEKNPKKQIQKKDKKRNKYVAESVFAAHFWGVAELASQRSLTGRNTLSQTNGRTDG